MKTPSLSAVISFINGLITFLTFIFVDINNASVPDWLFNLIPALAVSGVTYLIFYGVQQIFTREKQIQNTELENKLRNEFNQRMDMLNERMSFVKEVIWERTEIAQKHWAVLTEQEKIKFLNDESLQLEVIERRKSIEATFVSEQLSKVSSRTYKEIFDSTAQWFYESHSNS